MRFQRGRTAGMALAVVGMLTLAACSSGSDNASSSTPSSPQSSAAGPSTTAAPVGSSDSSSSVTTDASPGTATSGNSAAAGTAGLDAACTAGASEGAVQAWLNFRDPDAIIADFHKDYPNVKVQILKITPEDAIPRIVTAVTAGKSSGADVVYGGPQNFTPLLSRNALATKVDWASLGVDPKRVTLDNAYVAFAEDAYGLGYNTDKWKPEDLPDTWEGLLDAKYGPGEILIDPRARPFEFLSVAWGTDKTVDFVQKLIDTTHPIVLSGSTAGLQSIARGEGSLMVNDAVSYTNIEAGKGSPVAIKLLTPVPINPFGLVQLADSSRPNASQCLIAWVAGPHGRASVKAHDGKSFDTTDQLRAAGTEISAAQTVDDVNTMNATIDKLVPIIGAG